MKFTQVMAVDATFTIDVVNPEGRSAFSNETLEQVSVRYPGAKLWDYNEWQAAHDALFTTEPAEIEEKVFFDMLEVLPPENWKSTEAGESFRMVEYTTGTITAHYVRIDNRYFHTTRKRTSHEDLIALVTPMLNVTTINLKN